MTRMTETKRRRKLAEAASKSAKTAAFEARPQEEKNAIFRRQRDEIMKAIYWNGPEVCEPEMLEDEYEVVQGPQIKRLDFVDNGIDGAFVDFMATVPKLPNGNKVREYYNAYERNRPPLRVGDHVRLMPVEAGEEGEPLPMRAHWFFVFAVNEDGSLDVAENKDPKTGGPSPASHYFRVPRGCALQTSRNEEFMGIDKIMRAGQDTWNRLINTKDGAFMTLMPFQKALRNNLAIFILQVIRDGATGLAAEDERMEELEKAFGENDHFLTEFLSRELESVASYWGVSVEEYDTEIQRLGALALSTI